MKISNITIERFRTFENYKINKLGRINLLVGTNNSGKTTILEAADVLMSRQKLAALWSILSRRGEVTRSEDRTNQLGLPNKQVEVRHLFKGHEINDGQFFKISSESEAGDLELWAFANAANMEKRSTQSKLLFDLSDNSLEQFENSSTSFHLTLDWRAEQTQDSTFAVRDVPLSRSGGLSLRTIRKHRDPIWAESIPVHFVTASSLSSDNIAALYGEIVLTPMEDLVLDALRIIEPKIERIAAVRPEDYHSTSTSRGGILVRISGIKDRVPIASMGDGIWRILGLALAMVHSQGGLLLVDEIDTGLHYTVMSKMWSFLNACSIRFGVQIIATTHSRDCYESLAEICREEVIESSEVTIQRIDRKRAEAVEYSEAEIIAAAKHDIEVR